jgi:hypothetical protein
MTNISRQLFGFGLRIALGIPSSVDGVINKVDWAARIFVL